MSELSQKKDGQTLSQKSGIEESILIEKHSAMGSSESQLYECFCHFTTNWNLGLHKLWIDDSKGKVIYRSKWFDKSELGEYAKAAISIAKLCNHNWITEFRERNKDGKRTKCSSSENHSRC